MSTRKGIQAIFKAVAGKSSISAGLVKNHKQVGCPPCDTIFVEFHRAGEKDQIICLTPDEGLLIAEMLKHSAFQSLRTAAEN